MNKQIIENAALMLLSANGETTTLDIKKFIRNSFPQIKIFQEEVSDFMLDLQESGLIPDLQFKTNVTNGKQHRVYFLASAQVQPQNQAPKVGLIPSKPYSSIIAQIPKYAIEYEGRHYHNTDKDYLQSMIDTTKMPFRYSKSKDEFQNLETMNIHHLIHVFKKDFNDCQDQAERIAFMKGIVALSFVLRHPEVLAI